MSAALPLTAPTAASVLAQLRALTAPGVRVKVDGSAERPGDAAIVMLTLPGWSYVQVVVDPAAGRAVVTSVARTTPSERVELDALLEQIAAITSARWVPVAAPPVREVAPSSEWLRDYGRGAS